MDSKKGNPARKSTFPAASFIAVLTGITSLLIFLTGKSSLPDIIKGEPVTETPTSTPTVTLTPMVSSSPTEAASQTPSSTIEPTLVHLTAQPPSDSELETVSSIWTLTKFRELSAPGSNAYTVEITHDSAWLWDCFFCTTDAAFHDFLGTLEVEFWIDKVRLKDDFIRIYDRQGISGWICRNWSTKMTGWPKDRSVFLEIRYTHSAMTSDGRDEFAAGEYSQTIVVVVKG
ncbi:MAG: hypothetical protein JW748_00630 [Anaerolineales bacterium]|nr:hypothetical protein [Anaerolineales bacterium]